MDPSADNSGDHLDNWWEISALAKTRPRVMCVLPTIAVDLVASSLATLGSRPVLPEGRHHIFVNMYKHHIVYKGAYVYIPALRVKRVSVDSLITA